MRSVHTLLGMAAVLAGAIALLAGCSVMPEEEPVPEELAILFTGNTGAELEPCG